MKYCPYCGKQLLNEAVLCVGCGCNVRHVRGLATSQTTKFCNYCGVETLKDAVVCPKCGCLLAKSSGNVLQIMTKILLVLSGVVVLLGAIVMLILALVDTNIANACEDNASYELYQLLSRIFISIFVACALSLAWIIPMTAHYFKATKKLQTVGTAFKVCTLIFVNLVAGILMLCENNAKRHKTKNTLS